MRGPSTSRATATVAARSAISASGMRAIAVSGFARKFCTMTSWIPLYARAILRIAKIESTRSASVSPMPMRMPVVNGMFDAPGVLEHAQPHRGVLVRRAEVRTVRIFEQPPRRRLEHHAHRRRDRLEPLQLGPRHDAGIQVRQQPGPLQHQDRHRAHVGKRRVVAVRVQPLARRRPALLGTVAEREQRLLAAQRRALRRDRQHFVRREERRVRRGSASWRTCSSDSDRGTAGSAG